MSTTTPRRRPVALLLGALVLPVMLGACSSSSVPGSSPTTTRATGHQGAGSVCSLVSPAQIRSVLGLSVEAPTVRNGTAATLCTYSPTDRSAPLDAVLIGYRGHVTSAVASAEQATLSQLHDTVTDVTGSGGQAYYYAVGSGSHTVTTLVSLVGRTQVTVTTSAPVGQAEALSTQIFTAFAAAASTTTTAPGGATTTSTGAG